MIYELQSDFEPLALAATAALEDQERFAGLFVMVRRDRQLVASAFQAFHVKTAKRAVRAGFPRFVFLFSHEPALRVDWHCTTITERVGQKLSRLINWFHENGASLPIARVNIGTLGILRTVTSSIQIPATLRPSRKKAAVRFLGCLLFFIGGVWMIHDGQWMGYFCGGFFALGLPIFALQFHPRAAYLHLAPDGFTFCSLFRAHTIYWSQVREFAVIRIGLNRMVAWNFTADYSIAGRGRSISKSLSGYEAALPDTYGMKPQELVELLENLRQRYVKTRNA